MNASRSALVKAGQAASLKYLAYVQRRAARQDWFRESGKGREEIARLMNVSSGHVRDHAKEHGFAVPLVTRSRKVGVK